MKKLGDKLSMMISIITDTKDKTTKDFLELFSEKRVLYVPKSGYLSALLCVMPL